MAGIVSYSESECHSLSDSATEYSELIHVSIPAVCLVTNMSYTDNRVIIAIATIPSNRLSFFDRFSQTAFSLSTSFSSSLNLSLIWF